MACAPRRNPRTWLAAAVLCGLLLTPSIEGAQVRLPDLGDRLVDPFQVQPSAKAIVFLFVSIECPISNRYAPEVRRVYEKFAARGVVFWLVYPNPAESGTRIQDHVRAFAFPGRVLRDPQHALVRLARVTLTPEAAIFDRGGRIVYRGRIDDRYVHFGLDRPAATKHDLEDALSAVLAGKPVPEPVTQAVGCFLLDFRR